MNWKKLRIREILIMKKIFYNVIRFVFDSNWRTSWLAYNGLYNHMNDSEYLKKIFVVRCGYELDLTSPRSYNEKLQWLKLHDRNPEYSKMVNKYEVKEYVADKIGENYIIPTLGVWDNFDDIDFNSLPDQFVLKCTHDSGGLVICKDKSTLNKTRAKKKINKSLKRDYYLTGREWPYKNVKPRIIAEEYMEDEKTAELRDYKFFCFDGEVKALFIATERQKPGEEVKFDFFDENFNHLPIRQGHPNAKVPPKKPEKFEEMKVLAAKLSEGIPHVRVDFYEVNGKIYFGEMTFFHFSGMMPFEPREWDNVFGGWVNISKIQIKDTIQ